MARAERSSTAGVSRAALLSASWAVGVAVGVALGAYLTAVGGAGAPGIGGIDLGVDLLGLPALSFAAVFAAGMVWRLLAQRLRTRSRATMGGSGPGAETEGGR